MNTWANTVLTDKGAALLSKLTQGNTLQITRAITGSGFVTPGLLAKQTEVSVPQQELEFRPVSYPEEGQCTLTVALRNEGLAGGYEATQVGIYAMDPDEGEILFFLSQSASAEKGTPVPSEAEMPGYSADWIYYLKYGQADGVTVVVDPAGAVSRAELAALIASEVKAITYAEIDAAAGFAGNDDSSGDSTIGGNTGVGTLDHNLLHNRNIANQHTISAITGLDAALSAAEGQKVATVDIESAWNDAV